METNTGTPRKRHVLILDDDIPLAWSFKETLEQRGCAATIVPDGGLALKFVLEHHLDAVVCDLQIARLFDTHFIQPQPQAALLPRRQDRSQRRN